MEKFLEYLQFSTAIPFGYSIFFTLCILAWFWGAKNVVSSIRSRKFSSGRFLGGTVAVSFVTTLIAANLIFEARLDLVPPFDEADVVGNWTDGGSRIQFRADRTAHFDLEENYASRLGVVSEEGTWQKWEDFTIKITGENSPKQSPPLRVIKAGEEYRLIIEDFEDFDMWDNHLGFKRDSG